jgi:DNA-binding response OmpR family regulator
MASVLVVHSDEASELWATSLRAKGFAVHRVRHPEEAFHYIDQHPPAVIVTDSLFRMSGYNGTTFINAIRKHKGCASSRIIVCSTQRRVEDERQDPSAGADLFLGPADLRDLPKYLTRLLSQHRRANSRK